MRARVRERPCAVCGRAPRGFGLRPARQGLPWHHFCSMRCLEIGSARVKRGRPVIDKTRMERQAIKDARRPFAEALTELGLMEPFHDRTAEEIDRLIEACVTGFQDSMQAQALNDAIPF